LASVVKSLPAILSIVRSPALAIRRRPATFIDPSGKANVAATSSRNGVVSVMESSAGIFTLIATHLKA
jgi:hypothetical protein